MGSEMRSNLPFNVMRHANSWEVAPRDPSYVAAWAASFFTVGSTASTVAYYAAYAATVLAVSYATSEVIAALVGKPDLNPNSSGQLLTNRKDALAASQFVYGKVRKGGVITYQSVSGEKNKVLHQIIVLAGHEVEEIGDIYLNDQRVNMTAELVTDAPYQIDVPYVSGWYGNSFIPIVDNETRSYLKIYKHDGSQTSVDDNFSNSSQTLRTTLMQETGLGESFVGKGLAYLYIRMEYDQDVWSNGMPTFTAEVKGKKVVKTVNGVEQSAEYSNNSAWCIRDFLASSYGLKDDSINYSTFEAAAEVCDDTTVVSGGLSQYVINGVINSNQSIGSVLQGMMTSCGGTLFWGSGKWRLFAGEFVTPTKTLTLDDFRSGISLDTKVSMRDNFNTVRGTFVDESQDYISADYPPITSSIFLTEDNGVESALDLNLPYTTNSKIAQRLAKQILYRGREQLTLSADFGMNAFDVEVGDFIKIRNERYGWDTGSEKTFEVVGWKLTPDSDAQDLRVNLQLRESSSSAFGFSSSDEQQIISNNTTLLKYYEVPSIGVTVSQEYREVNESVVNVLVVTVTSDDIDRVDSAILKYKKSLASEEYKSVAQTILINDGDTVGRFEIVGVDAPDINDPPINYTFSVTPVNSLGYRGTPTVTTYNLTADTTPPSEPSLLSHLLSGGTIFFNWTPVIDLDLSHYKLYYSSSSSANFGDASTLLVVNKIARPATSISYPALAGKFFVSSVDKTGNESADAATTTVDPSELPQLDISYTHTESPPFSGPKTNLTVSSGALFMSSYSTAGSTGTYSFYHNGNDYFDVSTSRTVRLSSTVTVSRKHLDAVSGEVNWDAIPNNWDTWPDNWDTWTDETADFADFAVVLQARAATTVAGLSSAQWVAASGEVVGQFVQFRAILSNTNAKITPNITALSATVEY